jgi:WD40 repeat protein/tRNA A-37 threonylcarbamoyl transferase component Bud32
MPALFTCPQGHQWQPAGAESTCPVCGQAPAPTYARTLTLEGPAAPPAATELNGPGTTAARPPDGGATLIVPGPPAGPLPEGPRVPGYEVEGELGRGGMGVVYKARQVGLHRTVALKMILSGGLAGATDRARFHAEAEAVARLHHANIVQIYEVGEAEGCPFFSLEYVDGGSLDRKLRGAPQPPRTAAYLVRTLAHAVHYAHQHGIVHRDLKPVNILLASAAEGGAADSVHAEGPLAARAYGVPKIADFGLAKDLTENLMQTQSGSILGTPSYMAPEQAEGHVHAIGAWTDVYALGAILYEMLTGKPPFRGASTLETLAQVVQQEPVKPTHLQPKVDRDLETVCLKCLQKEPKKRYATAQELADDLDRFLDGQPIQARPAGRVERAWKWARRRPAAAALAAVSALAALALAVGGAVHNARLARAVRLAEERAEESRQTLVRLHVANGTGLIDAGDSFAALPWLTEALRLDGGDPGREEMHRRRLAAVLHPLPRLSGLWAHPTAVNDACFSPDGRAVATAADDGRVRVRDAESGRLVWEQAHGGPVGRAVFSADGRLLATASQDGTARVWEAASGQAVTPPLNHGGPVHLLAFSPDGKSLVTAGSGPTARLWDVTAGKLRATLKHDGEVHDAAFSPDSKRLVTAGADRTARVWDTMAGEAGPLLRHGAAVNGAAFSADGKRVVTASADATARVWEAATGKADGPPLRHEQAVTRAAFSPDGARVVTGCADHAARVWDVATGREVGRPMRHQSDLESVAFSPEGARVVTAGDDNVARVWAAADGRPLTPPLRHNGTVNAAAFDADGRRVVTASDDDTVRVWDLAVAQHSAAVDHAGPAPATADAPLAVSPDGRLAVRPEGAHAARLYDAATGEARGAPLQHRLAVRAAAFSPDGRRVVTASRDQTARVWDAATGAPVSPPLAHASEVNSAAFSPDGGRVLTTGDDNTARVWGAETGELLLPPLRHQGTVVQASFSADGRLVATASRDRSARVWDAATGEALTPSLRHPWAVRRADFSPAADRLTTAGPDGAAWAWELGRDDRPVEDLVLLAQVLSGGRVERRGLMPLDAAEQARAWEQLRERHPEAFTASPAEVWAWRREVESLRKEADGVARGAPTGR